MPDFDALMAAMARLDELASSQGFDAALAVLELNWDGVGMFAVKRAEMIGPYRGVALAPEIVDALAIAWLDGLAVGLLASTASTPEGRETAD